MKLKSLTLKHRKALAVGALAIAFLIQHAAANERLFTYTYEPETMPADAIELEQWVSLNLGRKELVGGVNDRQNYGRWELRTELEYGVSDIYQVSLYLNAQHEGFRDATFADSSKFEFKGISVENIVNVINPANHPVGLSLYLEPGYAGDTAEIEQKIILGQRHGDWKWAFNLNHAVEWENQLHDLEGEFGVAFGLSRRLGKHWALGFEIRNVNKAPDYKFIESSTICAGPVVNLRREKWWATLTVTPQIFGRNWDGAVDGQRNLDLVHSERVTMRLVFGFDF